MSTDHKSFFAWYREDLRDAETLKLLADEDLAPSDDDDGFEDPYDADTQPYTPPFPVTDKELTPDPDTEASPSPFSFEGLEEGCPELPSSPVLGRSSSKEGLRGTLDAPGSSNRPKRSWSSLSSSSSSSSSSSTSCGVELETRALDLNDLRQSTIEDEQAHERSEQRKRHRRELEVLFERHALERGSMSARHEEEKDLLHQKAMESIKGALF